VGQGPSYDDNDKSASRCSRDVRDEFGALLDDSTHNRFGAHIVLLWESSRGSRKVVGWVTLIELCETRGVRIWVHSHNQICHLHHLVQQRA
jgi:DNA invertase Pin-like site-specific DNA recombinase